MGQPQWLRVFYLLPIILLIKPSLTGLTVAKPCGKDVICREMTFCDPYGTLCKECSDVCDVLKHNYDLDTCHKQCQDYLHDQQFVKRSDSARDAATLAELSRSVKRLQVVAWLSMAFSGLAAVLLLGMCASKVARARRRHGGFVAIIRNKLHAFQGPEKVKADHHEKGVIRADTSGLKLEIPLPLSQSTPTAPNTASTTLPSTPPPPPRLAYSKQRSPSEDATLDYAYDNPALTPSPTLTKSPEEHSTKRETNF